MNSQYKLIRCTINGKAVEKMVDVREHIAGEMARRCLAESIKLAGGVIA